MNVKFSGTLLRFVDYNREIKVEARTIGDAFASLLEKYPPLGEIVFDNKGMLRRTHRLFLNGEMLIKMENTQPVAEGDTLEILTAIAGG